VFGLGVLVNMSAGNCVPVTVAVAWLDFVPLPDVAVAILVMEPASRSACVIVWVAVQLVEAPGANEAVPQAIVPSLLSLTVNGPARVTVPELVILYV
jgi:hypothetical protein